MRAVHNYLQNNEIEILNDDFAAVTQNADQNSFVYFDPPYLVLTIPILLDTRRDNLMKEQLRLRDVYVELTNRGVKCLLSNADTDFIRKIFGDDGFEIITVQAKEPSTLIPQDAAK